MDSIDDALGADHERLDALLRRVEDSPSPETLDLFARGLLHHMTWEEGHLFPAVRSRATAAQRRSIESLEIDHERIRETLDTARDAAGAGDAAGVRAAVAQLRIYLEGHNYDEEHGVYVEADGYLDAGERARLLEAFRKGRPA